MRALVGLALAGAVGVAGCGLDMKGLSTSVAPSDGGDGDDGGLNDAAAPDADGGPSNDGGAGACIAAVPPGWSLVVYEVARNACPAGFGSGHDELSGAFASPGACTCTCQPTGADCTSGTLATWWGKGSASCSNPGESVTVAGSTCEPLSTGGTLGQYYASQPVPFRPGTCTGTAVPHSDQVTKQPVRYCDVPVPSAEAVCEGMAPPGFQACIAFAGDVACPAGSPFRNRTVVADDELLSCSACTTCIETGSCSSPKVTFFSDSACTSLVAELASDGSCVPTNANNQDVAAVEYSAQVVAACSAGGSTASFTTVGAHTLCCR